MLTKFITTIVTGSFLFSGAANATSMGPFFSSTQISSFSTTKTFDNSFSIVVTDITEFPVRPFNSFLNNGFGNGDQDAPGGSGPNNNAENALDGINAINNLNTSIPNLNVIRPINVLSAPTINTVTLEPRLSSITETGTNISILSNGLIPFNSNINTNININNTVSIPSIPVISVFDSLSAF